ncbi:hypothetical protein Sjap_013294 [Stephania japonica]|uniref:Myb/SANT-like domain-containing protein n=1 Tax=Stephania japonica TaxID=461633 RepID=A0AAP0IZL1_9MAGN
MPPKVPLAPKGASNRLARGGDPWPIVVKPVVVKEWPLSLASWPTWFWRPPSGGPFGSGVLSSPAEAVACQLMSRLRLCLGGAALKWRSHHLWGPTDPWTIVPKGIRLTPGPSSPKGSDRPLDDPDVDLSPSKANQQHDASSCSLGLGSKCSPTTLKVLPEGALELSDAGGASGQLARGDDPWPTAVEAVVRPASGGPSGNGVMSSPAKMMARQLPFVSGYALVVPPSNGDLTIFAKYLTHLEKAIRDVSASSGIKAKPHIESRLKYLKTGWGIVNDMIQGIKHGSSGFRFDSTSNLIVASDDIWDNYLKNFPAAKDWWNKSFPNYEKCCLIYWNDRAIGENARGPNDVLEDGDDTNSSKESGMEATPNMEVETTPTSSRTRTGSPCLNTIPTKKKKVTRDERLAESMYGSVGIMAEEIRKATMGISVAITAKRDMHKSYLIAMKKVP